MTLSLWWLPLLRHRLLAFGLLAALLLQPVLVAAQTLGPESPQTQTQTQTLTLGMLEFRPKSMLQVRWQPLVDYLSAALPGYTVRLRILKEAEIGAALANNELDFVFTNPNHFTVLRAHNALSGALATLVRQEEGVPTAHLGGVILRLKERTDLQTLADLAGRRIAAPGKSYLGGFIAPAVELLDAGVDLDSLQMHFTGQPHDRVIQAVLSGQVDAGFVRSGVIEQLVREGVLDINRLAVIQPRQHPAFPFLVSTRLYPEWPFVALPSVDAQVTRRVAAALLALEADHPVSQSIDIHGFNVPADYSSVERMLRELRLTPFDQTPKFTWRDVWSRFQVTLIVLFLAVVGMLGLGYRLLLNNRRLSAARNETEAVAKQLEWQRGQLKTLIQTVPDLIWVKDAEGVYLSCNPRFERFFGTRETNIVGKTDYDFVDREQADSFRANDHKAMAKGAPSVNEEWVTFADDGHVELVETTKVPMFDAQGGVIGVLGIAHDITERKSLEDALAKRDQYQRALLDNFPFMVWLKDADSRYLAANRPFAQAAGIDNSQDLIGKTDLDLWPLALAENYRRDDREVLDSGQTKVVEEVLESNGQRIWLETCKSPILEAGQAIGTVGFARDISAQKRAEDVQRYSAFQAGIAEMSVTVLHNIGNAITAVLNNASAVRHASSDLARVARLLFETEASFAGAAQGAGLDAVQAGRLLAILRQAALTLDDLNQRELDRRSQQIVASVEHIAEIVHIHQNAALPRAVNLQFDLATAVHDALSMLEDVFKRCAIRVDIKIDPTLGMLSLSRNRLLQALINLLKNAGESICERRQERADWVGEIQIFAQPLDATRFRVEVRDNGIGFSAQLKASDFQFGFSTKLRGSGFGLHATHLFVQELGGTLTLESPGLGQGACCSMELPRTSPANDADAAGDRLQNRSQT